MNKFTRFSLYTLYFMLLASSASAATSSFSRDLTVGSRGTDVEALQNFLTAQKAYTGPITGYFGALTRAGVSKFQEANGISPAAGYFGPRTRTIANQKSGASAEIPSSAAPAAAVDIQKQIEALTAELQKLQSTPAAAPATSTPAPVVEAPSAPAVFSGSVKIFSIYPNLTLSSYSDVALNEFQLSASTEKVAVTKLRLTNTGTLSDIYFNEIHLVNSANNEVLASLDAPVDKIIEFALTPNAAKKDKGLMVSGGVYAIRATLKTPSSGSERKPNIKLDIVSSSDITAVDYDTLSKPAKSESAFPVDGPYITTF